jgi:hypothetical protein
MNTGLKSLSAATLSECGWGKFEKTTLGGKPDTQPAAVAARSVAARLADYVEKRAVKRDG